MKVRVIKVLSLVNEAIGMDVKCFVIEVSATWELESIGGDIICDIVANEGLDTFTTLRRGYGMGCWNAWKVRRLVLVTR